MHLGIPDGYIAVPIFEAESRAALQIAVLVAKEADSCAGALVLLRTTLDARVYLGAVTDAGGHLQHWVEIWVQTVAGLKQTPCAAGNVLTNKLLDERWGQAAEAARQADPDGGIWTGWEQRHPAPIYIRPDPPAPNAPCTTQGAPWTLCQDDALLERHGLPPYRLSLNRYLVSDDGQTGPRFTPVTPDAPVADAVVPLTEAFGPCANLIPLNPEGGLLMVRTYQALDLAEYLDALGGGAWNGVACGRTRLDPCGVGALLGSPEEPNRLYLETAGAAGKLVEVLSLKLSLLADAFRAVQSSIRTLQRPLLNLDESSFRVRLTASGSSMPSLWTAWAALSDFGDAVMLPIQTTENRYFVRGCDRGVSIFRPPATAFAAKGRGGLRIRQVLPETARGLAIEGTWQTRDELTVGPRDLVWIRVPLPTGAIDLYAHLEEDRALARGEWRLRTIEQRFGAPQVGALRALLGIPMPNLPYEVLPLQSSPCDLYALAVLAMRVLLVNSRSSLAVALDGMESLAREAEAGGATDESLSGVVAAVFARDARWSESLGPQFLANAEVDPRTAFQTIPPAIWWDTLAMLLRMLPGKGRFATCHDLGDAPPGALHEALQHSVRDAARLSRQARSLIVGDGSHNREIREIVDACRKTIVPK